MKILISGASTGIGAATARLLGPSNTVYIHYNKSRIQAEQLAVDIEIDGGEAELLQADLSNEEGCLKLFETLSELTDSLDILINNAGSLIQRQSAEDLSWDLMSHSFSLNVFSTMKLSSLCLPLLRKSERANIINITSVAARHGAPTATIYGATKGALDSFTRGLAKELAPAIRVNAVAPGVILTPFHEQFSSEEQLDNWRDITPLQKHGLPEDIAKTIEFIINSDFITGETIDVNGGIYMR